MEEKNTQLEFPLDVFVDTQIFINQNFNISEKSKLGSLKKQVKKGAINFLTSEIIVEEAHKHIQENIERKINEINKIFNSREITILRDSKYNKYFENFKTEEMVKEAISQFQNYLDEVEAKYLDIDSIELRAILDDYFNDRKPFGAGKKKYEFPDAFNISMLMGFKRDNKPIYVISGDRDFEGVEGIVLYQNIDELLNRINIDKLIAQKALRYINNINDNVTEEIKRQFFDDQQKIEVDGFEYDRKGIVGGYEYDEIELQNVNLIDIISSEVIDYNFEEQKLKITIQCLVEFVFDCTFFDEENSVWDSVDKEYLTKEYGLIKENHNKEIELMVNLSYKNEKEDSYIEFYVENIIVDTMQKFTQRTLNNKGRQIINYSNFIYENYCPDCGDGLTYKNDGGNGFCIKCAHNH